MYFTIKSFNEHSEYEWDQAVSEFPTATFAHTWDWNQYSFLIDPLQHNRSFIGYRGTKPLVICSLFFTKDSIGGKYSCRQTSGPNTMPIFSAINNVERDILVKQTYAYIRSTCLELNADSFWGIAHSLTQEFSISNSSFSFQLEPLKFNFQPDLRMTCVVDLRLSNDQLSANLSQSHRRKIRDAEKKELQFRVMDFQSNFDELNDAFTQFQHAHFVSAGKRTRPESSWRHMQEMVFKKRGTLFTCWLNNEIISYLFCGEFSNMAFGWSQVNIEKYERECSPRHFLEWQAIQHYKKLNFSFYEVGDRFFAPQLFYQPSQKEITISDFKERFGGLLINKILWHGFFSTSQQRELMKANIDNIRSLESNSNEQ